MKPTTLQDVANAAGVSYATVDRVVNGRGGVAAKSAQRVQAAIAQLRYARDQNAANLARRRIYSFAVLLPDPVNPFFAALRAALDQCLAQADAFRTRADLRLLPAFDSAALVAAIDRVPGDRFDALCVVALDTPPVRAALERARGRGLAVVTLVADVDAAARDHYIGIDNALAGRTAGRMMGLAHGRQPGRVLPILGTRDAFDHRARLDGFAETIARHFPDITLGDAVESGDDPARIQTLLEQADAPFTGLYNIGAGNAGLLDWLRRAPAPRPVTLIHELLPEAREGLDAGLIDAVIDQKPAQTMAEALRAMRHLADGLPPPMAPDIAPAIYLRENLPPAGAADIPTQKDTPA